VTEEGLFPCGHRKDDGPARPPVKVLLAAWAPLGVPLAPAVVPGPRADEPLYVLGITRIRVRLRGCGRLSGGECQRGTLESRVGIQAGGDCDLGPWSERQVPSPVGANSLAPGWTGAPRLTPLSRGHAHGHPAVSAAGLARLAPLRAVGAGARCS
jgi:hypothetical protein